jgi:hypothetical protein
LHNFVSSYILQINLLTGKQTIICSLIFKRNSQSKKATRTYNVMMHKIFAILAGLVAGKARLIIISRQTAGLERYGNPNGGHN